MTDVFVFGTLRHLPLLKVVGGAGLPNPIAAVGLDHATHRVEGHDFPQTVARVGASAAGLLLRDCPNAVLARLDYYEAAFGYFRGPVQIETDDGVTQADAYFPDTNLAMAEEWDLAQWQSKLGDIAADAAVEVMAGFGQTSVADLKARFTMMQVRADARVNARANPSPASTSGLTLADAVIHDHRRPYTGYFALEEMDLSVPHFDGGMSPKVTRSALVASDAAIVLPYDPVRDKVMLVEQFRAGACFRADPHPWLMEPIAGRIDPGEDSETTARREGMEEAGIEFRTLHKVHTGYASPGDCTEYFHIFVGIADLPEDAAGLGGLADEQEDIRSHIVDFPTFLKNLTAGAYPVTPLATAGYWLAAHRNDLRTKG